jgi:hypothetical protein
MFLCSAHVIAPNTGLPSANINRHKNGAPVYLGQLTAVSVAAQYNPCLQVSQLRGMACIHLCTVL